jgi:hypothetical protein
MQPPPSETRKSSKAFLVGWIISGLLVFVFAGSGIMKLTIAPKPEDLAKTGIPVHLLVPLGVLELLCAITYLVPPSSVLGAILLTGYIGGAIFTHLRIGEGFYIQAILGILVWLGLCLREPRLWHFVPLRKDSKPS